MFKTVIVAYKLLLLGCVNFKLKMQLFFTHFLGIIDGFISFTSPLILSLMVKSINEKNSNDILFYFYILIALSCSLFISRYLWRYYVEEASKKLEFNIKEFYYEKVFNKNYDWHLHNSVGFFSSALNRVASMVERWWWKLPFDYVSNFVTVILFLIYTYFISLYLFLYFFINIIIMCIIIRFLFSKRLYYIFPANKSNLSYNKSYIDFLYNIRSIKKMNILNFVKKVFNIKKQDAVKKNIKVMHYNSLQYLFLEAYTTALFLFPVGYFIYQFLQTFQGLEIIVMIVSIQPKIDLFARNYMSFMKELANSQAEYTLLADHLGDIFEKNTNDKKVKAWNKITFENTKFEFVKDNSIFYHNVPFLEINKGDHMAVTGKSGEGKSTFLNLLTRQFNVLRGEILIDKKNYNIIPESFFNSQITYISQDIELFDMTFYDNIVMGKRISKEKLNKVLKGCCLEDLIKRMNGNLHTDIGEKGIKLSGGERQRINLARGLLLERDILVLDEITANLDPHTTEKIWKFIFSEYKDKTIIAISHEKELLNHINRKIEFKQGKCKVIK